jgi:hypothetical protein
MMEDTIRRLEDTTFFSKAPIEEIHLYYIYINNNVVESIEKETVQDKSILTSDFIQERFMHHKIYKNKAYTLNGLHKYNFEKDSVLDLLQSDDYTADFTQYKKIEPVHFSDTIYHYMDYASLFFILENKKVKKPAKTKKDTTSSNKNKTQKSQD